MEFEIHVLSKMHELTEKICTFVNVNGGYLFIGEHDSNTPKTCKNKHQVRLKYYNNLHTQT